MSLWSMAWLGSTPVGGPLVGWVGQEFGGRWSLVIGGVPTLLVGLLTYPVLARVDARRARADAEEADAEKPPGEEPPSEG